MMRERVTAQLVEFEVMIQKNHYWMDFMFNNASTGAMVI